MLFFEISQLIELMGGFRSKIDLLQIFQKIFKRFSIKYE